MTQFKNVQCQVRYMLTRFWKQFIFIVLLIISKITSIIISKLKRSEFSQLTERESGLFKVTTEFLPDIEVITKVKNGPGLDNLN